MDGAPLQRGNVGFQPGARGKVRLSVGEGITGTAVECMRPVSVVGAPEHERYRSFPELNEERLFTLISVVIALAGIGIGWFMFQRQPLRRMPRLLDHKYYVDEAYDAAIMGG